MPKAGSGFGKIAGSAARSAIGGASWTLNNTTAVGAAREVQDLYRKTYRNEDITYQFNGRGQVVGIGGKNVDRFSERASSLADELAEHVQIIDRDAERAYKELRRMAGRVKASSEEMKELRRTYQNESFIRNRVGKNASEAQTVARELANRGFLSHEVQNMNNVDAMAAINNAIHEARARAYVDISKIPDASKEDYVYDIYLGIMNAYPKVYRDAMKRRK